MGTDLARATQNHELSVRKWPACLFPSMFTLSGACCPACASAWHRLTGKVGLWRVFGIGLAELTCTRCRQPILEKPLRASAAGRKQHQRKEYRRQNQKRETDRPRDENRRVSVGDLQSALEVLLDDRLQHESQQQRRRLAFPFDEQIADEAEDHQQEDIESAVADRVGADAHEYEDHRIEQAIGDLEQAAPRCRPAAG